MNLRDAATTAARHADALENYVADLDRVFLKIEVDSQRLQQLEASIVEVEQALEKVKSVSAVVQDIQQYRRQKQPKDDILALAKSAISMDDFVVGPTNTTRPPPDSPAAHLEGELGKLRAELALAEKNSLETRLHELERAKLTLVKANIPAARASVEKFRFSPQVEACFYGEKGARVSPLTAEELGAAIDRTLRRMSSRFCAELEHIIDLGESDDPIKIHSAMRYMNAVLGPEADFVLELGILAPDALIEHYNNFQKSHPCCAPITEPQTNSSNLSSVMYGFAPQTVVAEMSSPQRTLPPAKHILTDRFTFSTVKELQELQRLRCEYQRRRLEEELLRPFEKGGSTLSELRMMLSLSEGGLHWPTIAAASTN